MLDTAQELNSIAVAEAAETLYPSPKRRRRRRRMGTLIRKIDWSFEANLCNKNAQMSFECFYPVTNKYKKIHQVMQPDEKFYIDGDRAVIWNEEYGNIASYRVFVVKSTIYVRIETLSLREEI